MKVQTVGMSCHEDGSMSESEDLKVRHQISNDRFCECELFSFLTTEPLEQVRSIEKVDLELFHLEQSTVADRNSELHLDISSPPPKFS